MSHRPSRHAALLLALALIASGCGQAPTGTPRAASGPAVKAITATGDFMHDALARADQDRDGVLSGRESGLTAAQFKAFDRDGSGALEPAEWAYRVPTAQAEALLPAFMPLVEETRKALDTDHNGTLSAGELATFARAEGKGGGLLSAQGLVAARRAADANGDAAIGPDEMAKFYLGLGAAAAPTRGLFTKLVDSLLGGYVAVTSQIAQQKAMHPNHRLPVQTPAKFGFEYEAVEYKTEDGLKIRGWYVPAQHPTNDTIICLHGIDDNRDAFVRQGQVAMLHDQYNQLLVDIRNQGESEGIVTSFGAHEGKDIKAAVAFLAGRGITRPAIYGISLGGASVIRGAAITPEVRGVVDDCAYATVLNAFTGFISLTFIPCPVLIAGATLTRGNKELGLDMVKTEPLSQLPALAGRPLLVIHGELDRNIPSENSRLIATAAGPSAELYIAKGGGHAASAEAQPKEYAARLNAFFARVFGTTAAAGGPAFRLTN